MLGFNFYNKNLFTALEINPAADILKILDLFPRGLYCKIKNEWSLTLDQWVEQFGTAIELSILNIYYIIV
jgi:hypothetical protein